MTCYSCPLADIRLRTCPFPVPDSFRPEHFKDKGEPCRQHPLPPPRPGGPVPGLQVTALMQTRSLADAHFAKQVAYFFSGAPKSQTVSGTRAGAAHWRCPAGPLATLDGSFLHSCRHPFSLQSNFLCRAELERAGHEHQLPQHPAGPNS